MKFLQYISVYLLIVGTSSEPNVTAEEKATNTTVATRSLLIQEENKINDPDVALIEKEILEEVVRMPNAEQKEFLEFVNNVAEAAIDSNIEPRFHRQKNGPRFGRTNIEPNFAKPKMKSRNGKSKIEPSIGKSRIEPKPKTAPTFSKPMMQPKYGKYRENIYRSTLSEPDKFILDQEIKLERMKSAVQALKDNKLSTTDEALNLLERSRSLEDLHKDMEEDRSPMSFRAVNEALSYIVPAASNTPNTPKSHQKSPALKHKHQHKNAPNLNVIYNVDNDLQQVIQQMAMEHHGTHTSGQLSHSQFSQNRPKFQVVFVEGDEPTVQVVTQPMVYLRVAKKQEAMTNLAPMITMLKQFHWDQVGNPMDSSYRSADPDESLLAAPLTLQIPEAIDEWKTHPYKYDS